MNKPDKKQLEEKIENILNLNIGKTIKEQYEFANLSSDEKLKTIQDNVRDVLIEDIWTLNDNQIKLTNTILKNLIFPKLNKSVNEKPQIIDENIISALVDNFVFHLFDEWRIREKDILNDEKNIWFIAQSSNREDIAEMMSGIIYENWYFTKENWFYKKNPLNSYYVVCNLYEGLQIPRIIVQVQTDENAKYIITMHYEWPYHDGASLDRLQRIKETASKELESMGFIWNYEIHIQTQSRDVG